MAWQQTGSLRGPAGKEVELRKNNDEIQWRLGSDGAWSKLIDLEDIQGDQGPAGEGIEIAGSVATYANLPSGLGAPDAGKGYLVESDGLLYIWDGTKFPADGNGVAFQGPPGTPGNHGKEVEIQVAGDPAYIQWRLGDSGGWTNLIAVSALKGDKGDKGSDGDDGKGWTSGSYDAGTGKVTFASADGLGFSTGDLRGAAGADGTKWFFGSGVPGVVSGSKVGDVYMDTTDGTYYVLEA